MMGDLLGLTVAAHTFDSSPILGIALQKHSPQTVFSEMTLFHFCLNACLMRKKIKFSGVTNLGSGPCSRLILLPLSALDQIAVYIISSPRRKHFNVEDELV